MNLTPLQGVSSPALAERYRQGDARLRDLFGSHPSIAEDWRKRAQLLDRTEAGRIEKSELASVLRDYQARLVPSEAVDRSIEELAPATRQAYLALAAAVADGFTVDVPEQGTRPRHSIAQ